MDMIETPIRTASSTTPPAAPPIADVRLSLEQWSRLDIETTASRLAAIAHPLRLAIVCLLAEGERSVGDISEAIGTSQPNVSQHLTLMHNRKLVRSRKEANRVFYSLSDDKIIALLPLICCVAKVPEHPN
ncbi:MAG: transcriptional regulator, ArsR family [Proteobacteria bacterium]|nr:transcriptional regulator, ArsR family [Pseudomonadota bacterium]